MNRRGVPFPEQNVYDAVRGDFKSRSTTKNLNEDAWRLYSSLRQQREWVPSQSRQAGWIVRWELERSGEAAAARHADGRNDC